MQKYYDKTPTQGSTNPVRSDGLNQQLAQIGSKIGDLSELETTDKSDLVSAINEVKNNASSTAQNTSYVDKRGLEADNVQDALDAVGAAIYGIKVYNGYEDGKYVRQSNGGVVNDSTWALSEYIPFTSGSEVRVVFQRAGLENCSCASFYDNNKVWKSGITSNGYTDERTATITATGLAYVRFGFSSQNIESCEAYIDGELVWNYTGVVATGITDELEKIPILENDIKTLQEDSLIKFPIDINSIDEYTNTYIIIASGKWARTATHSFYAFPVIEGEVYRIVANDNSDVTIYAFLKDLTRSAGATPNYADGEANRHGIPQGSSVDITIPATTKYLYFGGYNNDMDMYYSPKELYKLEELNPYVKSLSNKVNEIKDNQLVNGGKTTFGELVNPSYIIVASGKWSGSTTEHSAYFKEVEEGEVYRFLGNATTNGFYAFLKDKTTSKSGTPNYADGENGRYAIPINDETDNIIVPATAKYLYICNTNAGIDQKPQAIYSIIPINNATENLVSDVDEIKDVLGMGGGGEASGFSYYGEKIAFSNTMNFSSYATNAIAGQSSAIYGDYLFIVKDKLTSITCYNMATKTLLYTLTTGYSKGNAWHCNQCQFGTLRVNENDVFPVLYITVNNDSNGRCSWVAYRIIPTYTNDEISSFTIEEVQTIYLPAMTDDNCLGNVNIAVDYERNLLWGYGRNNNSQAANYSKATFVCFPMPALSEATVTYEDSDIKATFQDDWNMAYAQGGFIKNGKLVIMQGYASVNLINLRVIDLYGQRRQVTYADLLGNGFTQEPEGVFYYKGNIYTSANSTRIWRISIS